MRMLTPSAAFLRIEGADISDIVFEGGDLTKAARPLEFALGAGEKSVRWRQ